ncbi:MAG: MFS transporter, partial [Actinomycetota bacterium]
MEVVSGIGDGVFWVGLAAVLLERHSGAQAFALAALARLGPRALISAPAGVLADRVDRRRLLVRLDVRRAILMVVLAATVSAGGSLLAILVLVLCTYTLAAPYRPALTAALPSVAGESGLASANALVSTVRQLMTFIGPLFGAAVVKLWSPTVAFALNGLSFVVAAMLIGSVQGLSGRRHRHEDSIAQHRANWWHDIRAGWHEIASLAGLSVITLLVFAMYVARGAELMLFVLLAD